MDHSNREQRSGSLNEQTEPFDYIDMRLANDDALPTGIICGFECSGDFALSGLLTFAVRGKARVSWSASASKGGVNLKVAAPRAIIGHS